MERKSISEFIKSRFGMFIHWGIYSIPGGRWNGEEMDYIGEWVQSRFRIPQKEYQALAEQFNPVRFNAEEWVLLAKNAGMKYIVFTSKHHDGFAMYHSRVSRYNIVEATPFGRDVLRELAIACRKHEIKLGIYYSHCLDWSESDGADPGPDFPTNFGMSWGNNWDFPNWQSKDFSRYFENKVKKQIEELLTEYGPIFLLWFDCPMVMTEEQGQELQQLILRLQPTCLINGRIGYEIGDFGCLSDNQQPTGKTEFPLESPNTMNNTWGFKWDDHNWSNAKEIVRNLAAFNEKNVNYLLNIGPRPDGKFPEPAIDALREVAAWHKEEQVVIQNTCPNPFPQGFHWGWCTVDGNTLQFFIRDRKHRLTISGLRNRISNCSIPFSQHGEQIELTLPENEDSLLKVVKVEFQDKLDIDQRLMPQDGVLELIPATGTIYHGRSSSHENICLVGAAAEVLKEDAVCFIDKGGALAQWHHIGDGIGWQVYFPKGGQYEVLIITENRCHSQPWLGDRTVEICFNDRILTTELTASENTGGSFYKNAVSYIGVWEIFSGEAGLISLKTQEIIDENCINMNLIACKFQKKET